MEVRPGLTLSLSTSKDNLPPIAPNSVVTCWFNITALVRSISTASCKASNRLNNLERRGRIVSFERKVRSTTLSALNEALVNQNLMNTNHIFS